MIAAIYAGMPPPVSRSRVNVVRLRTVLVSVCDRNGHRPRNLSSEFAVNYRSRHGEYT